jgi:hypothetical protein
LLFALCASWSIATPIFGPPDEQAHAERAAIMARGRFSGRDVQTAFGLVSEVTVPSWFSRLTPTCFVEHVDVTPACVPPYVDVEGTQLDRIVMGAYSPEYFVLVVMPTRLLSGPAVVYLMRLLTGVACAAMLAWAFLCARRLGRWSMIGVVVAITPMVLYLASSVNPNGIEIASAVLVWSAATALARAPRISEALLAGTAIGFAICVNTRALSIPMAGFAVAASLLLADRARFVAVTRLPRVRLWFAVATAGLLVSVLWLASQGVKEDLLPHVPYTFLDGLGRTRVLLVESVASFGWAEVPLPWVAILWALPLGLLLLVALVGAKPRDVAVLAGVVVFAIGLPIVVSLLELPRLHRVWLGRYGLPLWTGVPVVAGTLAASPGRRRLGAAPVVGPVILGSVALAQVLAFALAARRYAVGLHGPYWYLTGAEWTPPVPPAVLLVGFACTTIGLATVVARSNDVEPTSTAHAAARSPAIRT